MKIKRLELRNFRCFEHLVLEDLPDVVLLVARNGTGKSSILDAILGAKEIARPYFADSWNQGEAYKNRHALKWPHQNRPPLRLGSVQGQVIVDFEPSLAEREYLKQKSIDPTCRVSITIERDNLITHHDVTAAGRELLGYNSPSSGIGFLDVFSATRFFPKTTIGALSSALSDDNVRNSLGGFHRELYDQPKWTYFKSFVAAMEMSDTSYRKQTGHDRDSMAAFRVAFDSLFYPKKFVGIVVNSTGEADVCVSSPSGIHDIDLLSDGEKELIYILGHLFRFTKLGSTVLWDTPEAHLNATLESKLVSAIRGVGPKNQYLIATHSIEMIASVDLDSIVVLTQKGSAVVCERPNDGSRRERIRAYEALGASVGVQLASRLVVFVEGKESNGDKAFLEKVFADRLPGCSFVAAQDSGKVLAAGDRVATMLQELGANSRSAMIIDRDYKTDSMVDSIRRKYPGVFVWPVHEIENLLLNPALIKTALDQLPNPPSIDSVEEALTRTARELLDWVACDWIAWEREHAAGLPSRWIAKETPVAALQEYLQRLDSRVQASANAGDIDTLLAEKRELINRWIVDGSYLVRMPGKQLLHCFLSNAKCAVPADVFRSICAGVIRRREIVPDAVAEVETWLAALNVA